MSRVLVLANHYNTLRIFRRELLIELVNRGHEVTLVIPPCEEGYQKVLESYGCCVRILPLERRGMNPLKDMKLFFAYRKLLRELKPEQVITYTIKCNIYGGFACRLAHIPCNANVTGLGSMFEGHGMGRKLVSLLYYISLKWPKRVFFENPGDRDIFVKDGIVQKEKCVVMPGAGVNTERFPELPYPGDENGIRFLYVGRIMREKGMDELFIAMEQICQKYPGTLFDFIGWQEDDYRQKVQELEAKGYLRFLGWKADVLPYYENCHCVLLPSWHEGMSNTLLEGASCGRPLITNAIHGCMEAVDDGVNGYLCEKGNAKSLEAALERMLLLSQADRIAMGQAGRAKMQREFEKMTVVEKTLREIEL